MIEIMMATYNGEKYLKEQLDSIVDQTYSDWHLLISDDGSTDGTVEIINSYIKKYPDKISLITNMSDRHGACGNFNNAIVNAGDADYYMFSDQDDVWELDKLEVMVSDFDKLKNNNPQLIYHEARVVDENLGKIAERFSDYQGLHLAKDAFKQLLLGNVIPGCTISYNKAMAKVMKPVPEKVVIHDWWIMITAAIFGQIHREEKSLINYRQHGENSIGAQKEISGLGYMLRALSPKTFIEYLEIGHRSKRWAYEFDISVLEAYGDKISEKKIKWIEHDIYMLSTKRHILSIMDALKYHNFREGGLIVTVAFWLIRLKLDEKGKRRGQ